MSTHNSLLMRSLNQSKINLVVEDSGQIVSTRPTLTVGSHNLICSRCSKVQLLSSLTLNSGAAPWNTESNTYHKHTCMDPQCARITLQVKVSSGLEQEAAEVDQRSPASPKARSRSTRKGLDKGTRPGQWSPQT